LLCIQADGSGSADPIADLNKEKAK